PFIPLFADAWLGLKVRQQTQEGRDWPGLDYCGWKWRNQPPAPVPAPLAPPEPAPPVPAPELPAPPLVPVPVPDPVPVPVPEPPGPAPSSLLGSRGSLGLWGSRASWVSWPEPD